MIGTSAVVGSPPMSRHHRALCRGSLLGGLIFASACENPNVGIDPPSDAIYFPSGMVLDPRVSAPGEGAEGQGGEDQGGEAERGPARWLFLTNGNRDLTFNAGSIVAVDLEKFWSRWYDPETGRAFPYCDQDAPATGRCVQPPGAPVSERLPCRRSAVEPQVIECTEGPFVAEHVRIGNFATTLAVSNEVDPDGDEFWRLWTPVRGDPSIAFVDVRFEGQGAAERVLFDCGQTADRDDPFECSDDYRLTHEGNDEKDGDRLSREPFTIVIDEQHRYGYVAHASGGGFSLIDLGGVDRRPELIDQMGLFIPSSGRSGGYGLAMRPCFEAGGGPMGMLDPDPNVPNLTKGCTRPLIYASYRFVPLLQSFTVTTDSRIRGVELINPGELTTQTANNRNRISGPILGDIAFADTRGSELFAVQTQPGALLQVDTSLEPDGEPANIPAAPPIEVCLQPTQLAIHDDGVQRLAFVSCFRSAYIFVVDLDRFEVVGSVLGGTGPHSLLVDPHREVLYEANTLEATLSVFDLSRDRPTRFSEIARLGLQEAFGE